MVQSSLKRLLGKSFTRASIPMCPFPPVDHACPDEADPNHQEGGEIQGPLEVDAQKVSEEDLQRKNNNDHAQEERAKRLLNLFHLFQETLKALKDLPSAHGPHFCKKAFRPISLRFQLFSHLLGHSRKIRGIHFDKDCPFLDHLLFFRIESLLHQSCIVIACF